MTDAEYKKEKKRIQALAKKWIKPIGLGWWRINLAYARDDFHEEIRDNNSYTNNGVAASCSAEPNYLHATITFYLRVTKTMPDDELEEAFIHELMHIFLSPMSTDEKEDEEERVATTLARGFVWIMEHYSEKPKKVGKKRK